MWCKMVNLHHIMTHLKIDRQVDQILTEEVLKLYWSTPVSAIIAAEMKKTIWWEKNFTSADLTWTHCDSGNIVVTANAIPVQNLTGHTIWFYTGNGMNHFKWRSTVSAIYNTMSPSRGETELHTSQTARDPFRHLCISKLTLNVMFFKVQKHLT